MTNRMEGQNNATSILTHSTQGGQLERASELFAPPIYFTPNVYVVVSLKVSAGFSRVVGKDGWFGESGKC